MQGRPSSASDAPGPGTRDSIGLRPGRRRRRDRRCRSLVRVLRLRGVPSQRVVTALPLGRRIRPCAGSSHHQPAEWRNLAAELAFRAMGFHTLRHGGRGRPPACVVEVAGVAAGGG